jgi:hypothetical protein
MGSLAERLRAGGCGIPAFYTPAGIGTAVADGGLPWRFGSDGTVTLESPPKEKRRFGGEDYVLEYGVVTDFALVRAWKGDCHGNLVYLKSAATSTLWLRWQGVSPSPSSPDRTPEHRALAGTVRPDQPWRRWGSYFKAVF